MAYQSVFKRYELKYLLDGQQYRRILEAMKPYMAADRYGRTTICNLYLDTDTDILIRRSLEKPVYKEKLRIRSYGPARADQPVFVELKKKYKGIVYKRRMTMPEQQALSWLTGEIPGPDSQIGREMEYFRQFYGSLKPRLYLCYDRVAYYGLDGSDFRVTFDDSIRYRRETLTLTAQPGGISLLPEGKVLMELKTGAAIPLWMTRALTENKIFKTSFSKYGRAYLMEQKGEEQYA